MPGIYLDYAATTPPDPLVREAMVEVLAHEFGNPASVHAAGRRARRLVEEAREQVAAAIGADPREVYFTSGATEADNLAIYGLMRARPGKRLLTSVSEHAAVLESARALERDGVPVDWLLPDARGVLAVDEVSAALRGDTGLAALMLVNNETGVITDIAGVAAAARERGALVFCDAVQAFGFEPLDVRRLGVDALALSGHKTYGPKGVGVLWLRRGLAPAPLLHGGGQERGLRPGTANVPAIVGMGVAASLAVERLAEHRREVAAWRDDFEARLADLPGVTVNGGAAPRGVKHCNITVDGVDGETLLIGLDQLGLAVSAGSACSAGSLTPSHVLMAMGLSAAEARASLRFSFGRGLSSAAVGEAFELFRAAVERSRAVAA